MSITIIGNATNDPELKFTNSGSAQVRLGVAVSKSWTDNTGQKKEKTTFYTVIAYRELAENLANSINKGTRVVITGDMENREWTTEDGQKRQVWELIASDGGPSLRWARASIQKEGKAKSYTSQKEEEAW